MSQLLLTVLNMSLTASYVIIFVIFVRLLSKKAPKFISYSLWGVVAFRLIIPFSFESIFSLMPRSTAAIQHNIIYQQSPQINIGIQSVDSIINEVLPAPVIGGSVNPVQIYIQIGTYIWILGMISLFVYSLVSIVRLKGQLKNARLIENNIYEVENLKTPFVLGLIRPNIYLPAGINKEELQYIILHEQTHIYRKDHIIKLIAFLILSIHWFNPFVWIAFRLMSEDMELSCDERVVKKMGIGIKKSYAASLLTLATERHILNGNPIAFGGGNVKWRIKNVLNYKKPKFWVIVFSVIIVTVIGIGLISNPKAVGIIGGSDGSTNIIVRPEDGVEIVETDKVTLIANNVTDDMYEGIIVQTQDKINAFPWVNVTNPSYVPTVNIADVNNDGKDEIIIILTTGYGTGVLQQDIHVLNMGDLSEINIQNPMEEINKNVSSTITEHEGKVNVTVKWNGKIIEKSYYNPDYAGIWLDEVSFGSHIRYDIIDDKIIANVSGAISPAGFPITVFMEYNSDLKVNSIAISLYAIPYEISTMPLTEIPYYQRGEVMFKDETFFEQWKDGHQPWLANAVDVVTVMGSNLIGSDVQKTLDNKNIELHTAEELRTKDGIIIKVIDKVDNMQKVELTVPSLGKYHITLESTDTSGILFIKEIIFYPN